MGTLNEATDSADVDAVFRAVGNHRRRQVLACLSEQHPRVLPDLAADVAAREQSTADVASATVDRVRVSLYHVHLPTLADAGLVRYDRDEGSVALREEARGLVEQLG